ncbi:MAG: AAA family ATPase [Parvibaculum sp.]|uniref:AAA family ATPase n=1 Tax=Parvibaculum sp. TaxID=2024848 RepID=UPI002723F327|nr:AAA family ATPase [Parvibaculum sp.]MDO8839704.1 AAA family ATPase [Parvibaculum sp.]
MLIVFSGLPGTGKSTIARELARRIGATYLRIDTIEQALKNSSLRIDPVDDAGYAAAFALAEDNLKLGRIVVADSVNPVEETRAAWRIVAVQAGCDAIDVEIVCSDEVEHRRRVETRTSDIMGLRQPTWSEVIRRDYRPWQSERIVIDTAGKPPAQTLAELFERLPSLSIS